MASFRHLVGLLVPFVLACSDLEEDTTGSADETGETGETGDETDYEVELLDRDCPFAVPGGRVADCFTLVVPLDRAAPEAGSVELPVAVLQPPSAPVRPPVVYLHGGPGGDVFDVAGNFFNRALSDDGVVVALDQRGSGLATPSLDCPEIELAWYEVFSSVETASEEIERLRTGYVACRERLGGLDLGAFNTSANADDLDDLRRALGYESWNVYGISYGTRLGLELMRRHGEHIERAVLDSVYPPQVGGAEWMVDTIDDALERLVAGCLDEVLCSVTFPDLAANLETALANLDAEPHVLEVVDPQGESWELSLTGADFYAGMFNALYDEELIPVIPLLIFQAAQGNYGFLADLADQSIPFLTGPAEGARLSIDCVDGGALIDPGAVDGVVDANPGHSTLFGAFAPPFCELWDVESAPQSFLDAVESEIPTLLLAGEYDPVTPVSQTELAAVGLPASELYLFPGSGHGVSFGSACAEEMTAEFFRDGAVDSSCWAALPTDTF